MDAANPYQPVEVDPRRPRRSLVVIVSAGLGSLLALLALNLLAGGPRSEPSSDIELAPAAAPETTTAPVLPVATVPRSGPTAPVGLLPSTVPLPPRWFPPGTPDYVRVAVLDNENLDVIAPIGDGSTTYFSVSARARSACGGSVYRITDGQPRELLNPTGFLFARGDRRWLAVTSYEGNECRPVVVSMIDTVNGTARDMPATGWFYAWSTANAHFVLYDYQIGRFTLYDAPSVTSLGLGVAPSFARELDALVGPRSVDRPGWVMGRVAFLPEGDLVAHIQCMADACPKNDTITGWFYVVDGQVAGESARVPLDKAPPLSSYCGV